jgi:hypothetical protein
VKEVSCNDFADEEKIVYEDDEDWVQVKGVV